MMAGRREDVWYEEECGGNAEGDVTGGLRGRW